MARLPSRRTKSVPAPQLAPRIMARLDELAALSSDPTGLTRLYLSAQHKEAANLTMGWMQAAGMTAAIDAAGTVVGRLEGSRADAKTLILGSHIDTVRNGGHFDGSLGVVVAIEAIAELQRLSRRLPHAIEICAFGDEEGVRFPRTLGGSRAVSGSFEAEALDAVDADNITMRQALIDFGCDPSVIAQIARNPNRTLGYIEVHIEQGPVLENEGQAVGVVTAISGASRFQATIAGMAGHAGTLPMAMRRDALTAAAEMVLAIEKIARDSTGLVATVGQIGVFPGAVNVVPGEVSFSIDIRSPIDQTRRMGIRQIDRELRAIARRRHCTVLLTETYSEKAMTCDHRFIRQFSSAIEHAGGTATGLPSGAGHDGLAMAQLCPIGMLFVRCKGGISHHPAESVTSADVEIAARVLIDFLQQISPTGRSIA